MLIFLALFVLAFHFKEELLKNDSVKIFMIDSDVDRNFLDSPALKVQPNSSHGSQVAAIIRSQSRASISSFSAENIINRIDKNQYLNALNEIYTYARLHPEEMITVNISLGFEESDFQKDIINKITELDNIVLIAAAGNNNREQLSYPAAFNGVIAIAALDGSQKMPGSNYGKDIDFSAPGVIEITQRGYLPALNYSRTYKITGTSFAAPQLTALLANILSLKPKFSMEEGLKIIENTAAEINDPLFKENKLGAGRIEHFEALSKAKSIYFWLHLLSYFSIFFAGLIFFYLCWQKYWLSGIFIFIIISTVLYLIQPLLLLSYYQFGLFRITVFLTFLFILYYILLKSISIYLNKGHNFTLIFKMAPYLNQNLKNQAANRLKSLVSQSSRSDSLKFQKIIKSHLTNCSSSKKCRFYLQPAAQLKEPPISLIISRSFKFNLKPKLIAEFLNSGEHNAQQKMIINAKLLSQIINESYQLKKKASSVAADLNDPVILVPLENLLLKRNQLELSTETQYFLLELLEAFGTEAANFSSLLEEIISESSNPWLKYHALQAYTKIAVNKEGYQEFIKKVRAKEKEPVTLALKK